MVSKCFICVLPLAVYFILVSSTGVDSLMCYKCSSYPNDTACADPFSDTGMGTCLNCTCIKSKFKVNDTLVYERGSAIGNDSCGTFNADLKKKYVTLDSYSCWTCDQDHCNSAATMGASLLAVVGAIFVAKFI